MVMPASLHVPGHDYAVTVKNVGDGPLYLNIALQQVMNPGMEHERKVPLSEIERPGLLAHPDRLSLGPGQSRKIALVAGRAHCRGAVPPVRDPGEGHAGGAGAAGQITAPMSVAIGYGVLVRHMPPVAKQTTGWTHRCEGRDGAGDHRHRARGAAGCAGGQVRHGAESGLVPWRRSASRMAACAGPRAVPRARSSAADSGNVGISRWNTSARCVARSMAGFCWRRWLACRRRARRGQRLAHDLAARRWPDQPVRIAELQLLRRAPARANSSPEELTPIQRPPAAGGAATFAEQGPAVPFLRRAGQVWRSLPAIRVGAQRRKWGPYGRHYRLFHAIGSRIPGPTPISSPQRS